MGELLETVYLAQDRVAQSQKDGAIASLNYGFSFFLFFFFLPPPSFFFEERKIKKGKKGICNKNQSSGLTRTLQTSVDWKDTRGTSSTIWHAILLLLQLLVHNFGVNKQTSKTFLRDTNYETPAINLSAYSLPFSPTTVFLSSSIFQFSCLPVKISTALSCFQRTPFAFFLALLLRMNEGQSQCIYISLVTT